MTEEFWHGKRVFITGHTGFKGGWLSLWLQKLGAEVYGYALDPPTTPNLFTAAHVAQGMASSTIADVRDLPLLENALKTAQPSIVFHLAAQSLVRASYTSPVETFAINVMGTTNLLDAAWRTPGIRAIVNVTTDKCYENRERAQGYREDDPLGGYDPYSSSKACAELVTASYRRSFLVQTQAAVATARAGNVIGGGDWAVDRLVPDMLRAMDAGEKPVIRNPGAVRPWQHVLEPLSGYLTLAEHLFEKGALFAEPWNFGPHDDDARPVGWIAEQLLKTHGKSAWETDQKVQPHETNFLRLDSSKASERLKWQPRWKLESALAKTLEWHQAWKQGRKMRTFTELQIISYEQTRSFNGTI